MGSERCSKFYLKRKFIRMWLNCQIGHALTSKHKTLKDPCIYLFIFERNGDKRCELLSIPPAWVWLPTETGFPIPKFENLKSKKQQH